MKKKKSRLSVIYFLPHAPEFSQYKKKERKKIHVHVNFFWNLITAVLINPTFIGEFAHWDLIKNHFWSVAMATAALLPQLMKFDLNASLLNYKKIASIQSVNQSINQRENKVELTQFHFQKWRKRQRISLNLSNWSKLNQLEMISR